MRKLGVFGDYIRRHINAKKLELLPDQRTQFSKNEYRHPRYGN